MRKSIPTQIKTGTIPTPRIQVINHAGVSVSVYSIGWFTYWAKLAAVTLRLWQRQHTLPKPIFSLPDGARWYTARELVTYSGIIERHYQGGRDRVELKALLHGAHAKMKTEYRELKAANKQTYPEDFFRLPAEQSHLQLLTSQQQTLRQETKRLLGESVLRVARHYHENKTQ